MRENVVWQCALMRVRCESWWNVRVFEGLAVGEGNVGFWLLGGVRDRWHVCTGASLLVLGRGYYIVLGLFCRCILVCVFLCGVSWDLHGWVRERRIVHPGV